MLVENGEIELIRLVEASKIPLSVAVEIATGTSAEIQRVLAEAYESGDLRGKTLRVARTVIRKRFGATKPTSEKAPLKAPLSGEAVAKEYQEHTRIQRTLVRGRR